MNFVTCFPILPLKAFLIMSYFRKVKCYFFLGERETFSTCRKFGDYRKKKGKKLTQ